AARLGGEELGIMLSYLSTKVLGQYDPFTAVGDDGAPGYLVLVAPNILHVERELDLDAIDFRRWVCLHEQTHAVQFAAAPWLADHLRSRMREAVSSIAAPDSGGRRLARTLRAVVEALSTPRGATPPAQALAGPLIDAALTEAERERLAEIVAVMSLLEGHADVVMDAVGPRVLPSVARIRSQFERRRQGSSTLDVVGGRDAADRPRELRARRLGAAGPRLSRGRSRSGGGGGPRRRPCGTRGPGPGLPGARRLLRWGGLPGPGRGDRLRRPPGPAA